MYCIEKKLEEEDLNAMAVLWELKRKKQNFESLESENKLLQRWTGTVLDGTVGEGTCSMKFVDRRVNELEPEYVCLSIGFMQRFGICCSREVPDLCNITLKNF